MHGIFFSLQIGQSALSVYILIGFVQLVTCLHKQDFSAMYIGASYFYTPTCTANRYHNTLFYLLMPLLLNSNVGGSVHCTVPIYIF